MTPMVPTSPMSPTPTTIPMFLMSADTAGR